MSCAPRSCPRCSWGRQGRLGPCPARAASGAWCWASEGPLPRRPLVRRDGCGVVLERGLAFCQRPEHVPDKAERVVVRLEEVRVSRHLQDRYLLDEHRNLVLQRGLLLLQVSEPCLKLFSPSLRFAHGCHGLLWA